MHVHLLSLIISILSIFVARHFFTHECNIPTLKLPGFSLTDVLETDPGAAADVSGRYPQLPGNSYLGNVELLVLWLPLMK